MLLHIINRFIIIIIIIIVIEIRVVILMEAVIKIKVFWGSNVHKLAAVVCCSLWP